MWAVERGHADTVKLLLDAGADSSLRDKVRLHHPCGCLLLDLAELSQIPMCEKANKTAAQIANREDFAKIIETSRCASISAPALISAPAPIAAQVPVAAPQPIPAPAPSPITPVKPLKPLKQTPAPSAESPQDSAKDTGVSNVQRLQQAHAAASAFVDTYSKCHTSAKDG
jgi:ankyrin repeat protein